MWLGFGSLYLLCIFLIASLRLVETSSEPEINHMDHSTVLSPGLIRSSLSQIFAVPGTSWMVLFVLTYKLCERGEAVFPIYLVDKGIPMARLAFWNGLVRSSASVSGNVTVFVCIEQMYTT